MRLPKDILYPLAIALFFLGVAFAIDPKAVAGLAVSAYDRVETKVEKAGTWAYRRVTEKPTEPKR
ncbi:MAG: hypothetical protein Q7K39_00475 [Candidatus Magasanikbacteria bacterium]|nr:hypothetical protein [Candidatus Magasanikbacteria bacterium]